MSPFTKPYAHLFLLLCVRLAPFPSTVAWLTAAPPWLTHPQAGFYLSRIPKAAAYTDGHKKLYRPTVINRK